MWFGLKIPNETAAKPSAGEQLPLALELDGRRPARKKGPRAPLVTCGQCGRRFRSWKPDAVCGCDETGAARPARAGGGPAAGELGTPADDGSLHFLMTGSPEPKV